MDSCLLLWSRAWGHLAHPRSRCSQRQQGRGAGSCKQLLPARTGTSRAGGEGTGDSAGDDGAEAAGSRPRSDQPAHTVLGEGQRKSKENKARIYQTTSSVAGACLIQPSRCGRLQGGKCRQGHGSRGLPASDSSTGGQCQLWAVTRSTGITRERACGRDAGAPAVGTALARCRRGRIAGWGGSAAAPSHFSACSSPRGAARLLIRLNSLFLTCRDAAMKTRSLPGWERSPAMPCTPATHAQLCPWAHSPPAPPKSPHWCWGSWEQLSPSRHLPAQGTCLQAGAGGFFSLPAAGTLAEISKHPYSGLLGRSHFDHC